MKRKVKSMLIMRKYRTLLISFYISFFTHPAYADFQKANKLLTKVEQGLRSLSLVTVTLAILWVGYKVLFGGSTIQECAPVIIGAIIIASAAEIAKMLVG